MGIYYLSAIFIHLFNVHFSTAMTNTLISTRNVNMDKIHPYSEEDHMPANKKAVIKGVNDKNLCGNCRYPRKK